MSRKKKKVRPLGSYVSDDDGGDVWNFYAFGLPFIYNEKKLFNINMR